MAASELALASCRPSCASTPTMQRFLAGSRSGGWSKQSESPPTRRRGEQLPLTQKVPVPDGRCSLTTEWNGSAATTCVAGLEDQWASIRQRVPNAQSLVVAVVGQIKREEHRRYSRPGLDHACPRRLHHWVAALFRRDQRKHQGSDDWASWWPQQQAGMVRGTPAARLLGRSPCPAAPAPDRGAAAAMHF